ncbi:MAG: hypothetical protein ACLQU3_02460 [Limisphaerales bacterium]
MNRFYAVWYGEGSAASADREAVFAFSNAMPSSGVKGVSFAGVTCVSMRGVGRAAMFKNARQNTKEVQAQEISKIVMGLSAALSVPCAACHRWAHSTDSFTLKQGMQKVE